MIQNQTLFALLLAALTATASAAETARRPNFVVILADDLGYMDIAAYASRVLGVDRSELFYETPHLDALVDSGAAFSQAYAFQLCSPTRAALLTGINPAKLGVVTATPSVTPTYYWSGAEPPAGRHPLDSAVHRDPIKGPQAWINGATMTGLRSGQPQDNGRDEQTFAEALDGYRCGFLGKWHVGGHGARGYQPNDQGFEAIAYADTGGSPYFNWRAGWDQRELPKNKRPQPELLRGKSGEPTGEGYLTDDLTTQAVRYLERCAAEPDQPFLLYLCHFAVHTPIQGKPEYVDHFAAKPNRGFNHHDDPTYAAMVKSLDDSVGAITDSLDALGLREDTVLIFLSDNGGTEYVDNGPTDNTPLTGGKATMFEGGTRVPMIVSAPGRFDAGWREQRVSALDLFPTLLDLAGQGGDIDGAADGQSVVPLLESAGPVADFAPKPMYFHYPFNVIVKHPHDGLPLTPHSAVRDGDYKLIFDWQGRLLLYNIADDLREEHNLVDEQPERAEAMLNQLRDWLQANVAPHYFPRRNPEYDPTTDSRPTPLRDLRGPLKPAG